MKVLFCGGHLTPALAMIDFLQAQQKEVSIIFYGREYSSTKEKQLSQEATELAKRQVKFVKFNGSRHSLLNLFYVIKAGYLLSQDRPDIFMAFGGYLSLPIAIACFILKIPVLTHEQTRIAGQSNLFISKFAKKVAISHQSSAKFFPAAKTVVTGNPLRAQLLKTAAAPSWAQNLPKNKKLLFITGGNQGSLIINQSVAKLMSSLVKDWKVIHACGNSTQKSNYQADLEQLRIKLNPTEQKSYLIRAWLTGEELAWVYQHASAVISRAGANTINELLYFSLPSILIPLPFAKGNEQLLNAKYVADHGGAILLPQKQLNAANLSKNLEQLKKYHHSFKEQLVKIKVDSQAAAKLWQIVSEL